MANYITEYWKAIQGREVAVSKRVRKVYKKLDADTRRARGVFVFDETKAARPLNFIEQFCKHSKGEWAGQSVKLALFQKAYISALFGFVHKDTGERKYKETLFMVGRKNGKSTLLAGIALYMLIADNEPGAEVYSTATKKDQARLVFDETHNMVKQSPELRRFVKKRKTDLYFSMNMSKFQALGKNSDTLDGLNASCVIMDELHGVKDRNLYEVMKQSQSARRQPMLIMITTAGIVRECIFDDMYTYACGIADGTFQDDTFLPVIYELDKRSEWTDPKAWEKANPGLGSIKKVSDLVEKVERAKNNPKDLSGILCKDFNIRGTLHSAWLTFDDINNEKTFDLARFKGAFAIGGADLSITTDLTCATLLMMDPDTEERFVTQMYWLPEANFEERGQKDKIPYDKWLERGLLRLCYGNTINYADVTTWFLEMVNDYGITPAWIGYDAYSAKYWVEEMERNGFNLIRVIQGSKTLSLPMQMLGADLQAKKINYDNNPMLKWCLTNTGIKTDRNGNIVPVKNQAAKQRIDGTASLLDAYVILMDKFNEFKNAL